MPTGPAGGSSGFDGQGSLAGQGHYVISQGNMAQYGHGGGGGGMAGQGQGQGVLGQGPSNLIPQVRSSTRVDLAALDPATLDPAALDPAALDPAAPGPCSPRPCSP